jgi:integrase
LKLEAAREAAQLLQGDVAKGIDIAQARKDARRKAEQDTFGQAVEKYLDAREKGIWPPRRPAPRATTFAEIKRYLNSDEGYFRPLYRTAVVNISQDDIRKRLDEIARTNGAVSARAARSTLSFFFAWAIDAGQCKANPVSNISKQGEGEPRSRTLAFDEIAKIWSAAGELGEYGTIVRMLLATLCRRDEIGELEWVEVDKEPDAIVLPSARTKNKLEHLVPLSPLAQEIVGSITRRTGYPHLFGLRKEKPFSGWSKAKAELDEEAGHPGLRRRGTTEPQTAEAEPDLQAPRPLQTGTGEARGPQYLGALHQAPVRARRTRPSQRHHPQGGGRGGSGEENAAAPLSHPVGHPGEVER